MPLHTESQNPCFKVGHGPKSCQFSPVLPLGVQAGGQERAGGCKLINILSLESPQSVVLPNHDLNRAVFRHRHCINLSTPNSAALGFREAAFLLGAKETNKALPSQIKGEGGGASSRTQKLK